MSRIRLSAVLAAASLLAACGEAPQVVEYANGSYAGKADTRPWESAAYGGDKARWESDMRARARKQTEIGRMPAD